MEKSWYGRRRRRKKKPSKLRLVKGRIVKRLIRMKKKNTKLNDLRKATKFDMLKLIKGSLSLKPFLERILLKYMTETSHRFTFKIWITQTELKIY